MAKKAKAAAKSRKTKGATASAAPMTAEERFARHFPGIRRAKAALERAQIDQRSANGEYRNKLKAFQADGGNIAMMILAMKDVAREPDEVSKDIRDHVAYVKLIDTKFGEQLELFGKPAPKAKAANGKAANGNGHAEPKSPRSTKETIAAAREQGKKDGSTGKTAYNAFPDGSPEALAYAAAFNSEQAAIAESLRPGATAH